jgi:hypothetical protein
MDWKKLNKCDKSNFIRGNDIGDEEAIKLGEGVSKLVNLTSLNMDFS